jgi:hypothetical protein
MEAVFSHEGILAKQSRERVGIAKASYAPRISPGLMSGDLRLAFRATVR